MSGPGVDVAFWSFGAAAVWFGWRVFRADSMVRATFSLLASFLAVGAIMILLLAEYLGVALFFMMAIEMTVMAVFMVAFMMNPAGLNPMMMVHQRRLSLVVGAAGAVGLGVVALVGTWPSRPAGDVSTSIHDLGGELLGDSMLVFESAGAALLATMIAAVVLSSRRSRYGTAADDGSLPPPVDPTDPGSVPDVAPSEEGGGHQGHGGHGDHGQGEHAEGEHEGHGGQSENAEHDGGPAR